MAMLKSILLVFIFFYFTIKIQLGCSTLQCWRNERNALFDFKQGLIDQSNRLSSWVGKDCCKWEGITCDNFTGHVVMLDLRNPFLLGFDHYEYWDFDRNYVNKDYSEARLIAVREVNPSLLELKHLNYLDLSWNNFSGIPIPMFFGSFHELSYLNLSNAMFGGIVPHYLGNLSALHSLDLGTDFRLSRYYHNIPSLVVNTMHWISCLNSLRVLDMSLINLSNIPPGSFQAITSLPFRELRFFECSLGMIPQFLSSVDNLTSLTILDLGFNHIQGPIPNAIRNMTSLKVLQISGNGFSSNDFSILEEMKNLNKLEILDLSLNFMGGKMNESRFQNFSSTSIGDNLLEFDLFGNSLTGYLPNWLHQLKSLKKIVLSDNHFEGEIPTSFGALQTLKELHLSDNDLSGRIPKSLTKLSVLQVLNLRRTLLSGPIPTSLGKMSALTELDLSRNYLSGDIPVSLGKLSNLKKLYLNLNQFNGSVPLSLGQCSQLTDLDLKDNQFLGVVSELHFARLSNLKVLDLNMNSLSLKLQSGWVPPFLLKKVRLGSCYVGPQFPDWLQTQTRLENLNMSNTGISDFIPNWFQNLTSLVTLDLSNNQIYGKIPNVTSNMVQLFLSSNLFEGSLPEFPSSLEVLSLSNNKFTGQIRADFGYNLPNLQYLFLSNNNLSGTIPNSLCQMFKLLFVDFSNNKLSGSLPHCLGDLQSVNVLDLTSNSLSGTIQSSFCHQSMSLTSLYLGKNNFHGELPSLQNCSSLSILDVSDNKFSGEIPSWIGQSLSVDSLIVLKLSSNKYNGGLSPKLCHLNNLRVLDLASNNLSGNIPYCFGNFSAMLFNQSTYSRIFFSYDDFQYEDKDSQAINEQYQAKLTQVIKGREYEYTKNLRFLTNLDLSDNNFVGKIPVQLVNLSGLFSLNLSKNHLTGNIPMKIGQMRLLESLDLSNNHLSGTIPQSISAITTLNHLNLSNNNLSGPIPSGNQLQTLTDPSIYDGNSELCGLPLEKKCTSADRKEKEKEKEEEEEEEEDGDGFITMWFYIGMAWGFVVGFWGFCGVLWFKKSWRYTYFQFVNDIFDRLFYTIARRKV